MADGQRIVEKFANSIVTSTATTTELIEVTMPINQHGELDITITLKTTTNNDSLTFTQKFLLTTNDSGLIAFDKGPICVRGTVSLLSSGWFISATIPTTTSVSINAISGAATATVWAIHATLTRTETTITIGG